MHLTLTALRLPAEAPECLRQLNIPPDGAHFGRGEGNTYVLPDPQQVLSQQHCHLFFQEGHWWVTDTSTNGVFLNSAPLPLGRNSNHRLGAGDTLDLGLYRFRVNLPEAPPPPPAPQTGWWQRLRQWWGLTP